jgi:hypothetical protein
VRVNEHFQRQGTTSSQGLIEQPISPNARKAVLRLGKSGIEEQFVLLLGHLDPVTTINGIQERLRNLEIQGENRSCR